MVQQLEGVDRWAVHASDVVHVAAAGVHIDVHQRVRRRAACSHTSSADVRAHVCRPLNELKASAGSARFAPYAHHATACPVGERTLTVRARAQVRELRAERMSVGAVTWDGAFVMLAYLGATLLSS